MSNFRSISNLISNFDEKSEFPNKRGGKLLTNVLTIIYNQNNKHQSDTFIFFPFLFKLLKNEDVEENIKQISLAILSDSLQKYGAIKLFHSNYFENFISCLLRIGFDKQTTFSNLLSWRLLRLLPSSYQLEILSFSGIESVFDIFIADAKRVIQSAAVTEETNAANAKLQPKNKSTQNAVVAAAVSTILRAVLLNWNTICMTQCESILDVSLNIFGKCISNFLSLEASLLPLYSTPVEATLQMVDVMLYNYLGVSQKGLHDLPLCFMDVHTSFNTSFSLLLTRCAPKLVVAMRTLLHTATRCVHNTNGGDVSIDAFTTVHPPFDFCSIWMLGGKQNFRYLNSNERVLMMYESWSFRSTLICLLSITSFDMDDEGSVLHQLKNMTQELLNRMIDVLSTRITNSSTKEMEAANTLRLTLYSRLLLCEYVLKTCCTTEGESPSTVRPQYPTIVTLMLQLLSRVDIVYPTSYTNISQYSIDELFSISYIFNSIVKLSSYIPMSDVCSTEWLPALMEQVTSSLLNVLTSASGVEGGVLYTWDMSTPLSMSVDTPFIPNDILLQRVSSVELMSHITQLDKSKGGSDKELIDILIGRLDAPKSLKKSFFSMMCLPAGRQENRGDKKLESDVKYVEKMWKSTPSVLSSLLPIIGGDVSVVCKNIEKAVVVDEVSNGVFVRSVFNMTMSFVVTSLLKREVGVITSFIYRISSLIDDVKNYKLNNQPVPSGLRTEEVIAVFTWSVCVCYMTLHPLVYVHSNDREGGMYGLQELHKFMWKPKMNDEVDVSIWIHHVTAVIELIWKTVIPKVQHMSSATHCVIGGMMWLLSGCTWSIYDAVVKQQPLNATIVGASATTLSVMNGLLNKRGVSEHYFNATNLHYSVDLAVVSNTAYFLFAVRLWSTTHRDAVGVDTILNEEAKFMLHIKERQHTLLRCLDDKMVTSNYGRELIKASIATVEMAAHQLNQQTMEDAHTEEMLDPFTLPDPFISSFFAASWKDTTLVHILHKNVVWREEKCGEIATPVKTVSCAPLMVVTQMHSRFRKDSIMLIVKVDVYNITDTKIGNVMIEIQKNIFEGVKLTSVAGNKEQPIPSLNAICSINETKAQFASMAPKGRESCAFMMEAYTFSPVYFSLDIKFDCIAEELIDDSGQEVHRNGATEPIGVGTSNTVHAYTALREGLEKYKETVDVDKQLTMMQPSIDFGTPLEMFVRPYFGLGMWHKFDTELEQVTNGGSVTFIENQIAGLKYQIVAEVNASVALTWNPKSMHMLSENAKFRIFVGEALCFKHLLMVIVPLTKQAMNASQLEVVGGDRKIQLKILSTEKDFATSFAAAIQYWILD